ncbi:MAG: hypothetical protein IKW51_04065, partial [Bacteroidales bacterium]|nr:hypothetical protein [Bacteroidales bacterium]
MKRLITTAIFAIAFMMNLNAQNTDGFFAYSSIDSNRGGSSEWGAIPTLPSSHGFDFDQNAAPAPIGSGLLVLGGLALAYGIRKNS